MFVCKCGREAEYGRTRSNIAPYLWIGCEHCQIYVSATLAQTLIDRWKAKGGKLV